MQQQRREVEIAERRATIRSRRRAARAGRRPPAARACADAAGARPGRGTASSSSTSCAQPRRIVDVAGAVRGREHVPARRRRRTPRAPRCARAPAERPSARRRPSRRRPRRPRRPPARARSVSADRSDEHSSSDDAWSASDAVELLRHRAVVRAHPGLDVRDRHARLRARQRARHRRVRVAVDEQHVGALGLDQRLQRGEHARGLPGVRAAAEIEPVLRPRQRQLVEEHARELVVVVLAGVDEHLRRARRAAGPRPQPPSQIAAGFQ